MAREVTLRLGVLTRILQRAELIEENERVTEMEIDHQVNQVTLCVESD